MTLERFKEWVETNYPPDRYNNVDELISDVERRVNSDGNQMNDKVKQLLLEQFLPYYDAEARARQEKLRDLQLASDMLGSGVIPRGLSEEIREDMQKKEIMGVDISDIAEKPKGLTPKEVIEGKRGFFDKLTSSFKGLTRFFKRRK